MLLGVGQDAAVGSVLGIAAGDGEPSGVSVFIFPFSESERPSLPELQLYEETPARTSPTKGIETR
jgi:hypothetical protein